MDIETLKEQAIERFDSYRNQIEDSEIYIRLKERYDNLQPNIQKLLKGFAIFLVVYIFYSFPAGFVSSAKEQLSFFEENRQLTRELIRAGRIAKTTQLPPAAPSPSALTSQVRGILKAEQVTDDQIVATNPQNEVASNKIVPKSINQNGVKATVKKLNLRQVVRIAEGLDQINSSRLMNIAIQADNQDPHYYSVDFELAAFSVPQSPIEMEANAPKKETKSRFKRRGRNQ